MRTIAVLNQKGGVGKTTTVANTAAALAAMGSRVLAIDLDPQAHLTIHLGLEPQSIDAGAYKVLTQSAEVADEIVECRENLWVLAANINLVGAETELVSVVGREIILREVLERAEDRFDYCLIDCPPSLGLLTLNSLAAAQEVLIPLQPHFLALQGVGKLLQTVELVNKRINPDLRVEGILLCMFDTRASLPSEVRADIEDFLKQARGTNCAWAEAQILPTFIRRNIKLAEAPSYGQTIFEYEQSCHGAEDYKAVAEYIHRGSRSHKRSHTQKAVSPPPVPSPPKPPQPTAAIQQPRPTVTPVPPQQIREIPSPGVDSTPRPIGPAERLGAAAKPNTGSSPVAQNSSPAAPQQKPKSRLSSTYEYRPQGPARPHPAQAPQHLNKAAGAQPAAEARPVSIPGAQPQANPQGQPNSISGTAPQPPARSVPAAGTHPQASSQPKPQFNSAYQYRAVTPPSGKPVAPRSIQAQPAPRQPMSNTTGPQGQTPIQAVPTNPQVARQPIPQSNGNVVPRPQAPVPVRPVAVPTSQAPAKPNPQVAAGNTANVGSSGEARQVRPTGLQTPQQQQAAMLKSSQPRAGRIVEITAPNQPAPVAKPGRATPTQGS